MLEMLFSVLAVNCSETSAKLFTLEEPPAQVQVVYQEMVEPLTEFTPTHCEPLVAELSPQRSL
jgi:hypothetical protein